MPDHYPDKKNKEKKVSPSKFLGRDEDGLGKVGGWGGGLFGGVGKIGKIAEIVRGNKEAIAINAKKITSIKNILQSQRDQKTGDTIGDKLPSPKKSFLQGIADNINGMLAIFNDRKKFEKKRQNDERKELEKGKRGKSEKNLETDKFAGIKKVANKVLAPARGIFEQLWDFIKTIILGRVAVRLWEWMSNKDNQKKIGAIGRFFKDWWPLLLGGYVLFGTGLVGFITNLAGTLISLGATITLKVIPAMILALKSMGPTGWAILGTLAIGGGIAAWHHNKNKKDDEAADPETTELLLKESGEGGEGSVDETLKTVDGTLGTVDSTLESVDRTQEEVEQFSNNDVPIPGETGEVMDTFNKGGMIPGRGLNKDTVPAMLTPGEFVMSRDAVDQWGANTFASMNAGISPSVQYYSKGGPVNNFVSGSPISYSGSPISYNTGGLIQNFNKGGIVKTPSSGNKVFTESGKYQGKDAPKGLARGFSGLADWATFGVWDIDQRGNLFGGKHSKSGFGKASEEEVAKEKNIAQFHKDLTDLGYLDKKSDDVRLGKTSPSVVIPGAPNKSKTTVVYDQEMLNQQNAGSSGMTDMKLPAINPSAMISQAKITTLGISV